MVSFTIQRFLLHMGTDNLWWLLIVPHGMSVVIDVVGTLY